MTYKHLITTIFVIAVSVFVICTGSRPTSAQGRDTNNNAEEEILPELPPVEGGEEGERPAEETRGEEAAGEEEREATREPPPAERIEAGEAREGENIWDIDMTAAVVMNYVFNNAPESFTITYRFEIKGQAKSTSAVIQGDADISADVEGFLARWPTGECKLAVSIPKVPFELAFNRTDEEKGSLRLVFKRVINEDWQSKCSFKDAPGARFDTKGEPEKWLTKALEKARPPLKSIVTELGPDETNTTFVIGKQVIEDAPLGSGEIEGTGVIRISPGG